MAVVEVAKKEAALAVVVATRFPDESVAKSTPAPTLERVTVDPAAAVRVAPESKVRVPPDSKLSEVSLRRKESESIPSRVWASDEIQLPPESWKHPPVRAIPLSKVEVAEEVKRILPPVMVSPDPEVNPPMEATDIPPAKVEVAVEEALMDWS